MRKVSLTVFMVGAIFALFGAQPVSATQTFSENPGTSWLSLNSNTGNINYLLHNAGTNNALEFAVNNNGTYHWQVMNLTKDGDIVMGQTSDNVHLTVVGGPNLAIGGNYNTTVQNVLSLNNSYPRGMNISRKAGNGDDPWVISTADYFLFTVDDMKSFSINKTGVQATKVIVSNTWADYVFDKGYKLMSLINLEKYIQQNGHLPNVPAADQIEKSGLDLGGMQKLQMEKIEELTLYTINQEKEISAQKQQIADQGKKISDLEARLEKLEQLLNK